MATRRAGVSAVLAVLAVVAVGAGTGASEPWAAALGSPVRPLTEGPQVAKVAAAEQAFALDLLGRLGPGASDLVLSPSSIATLLAMLEPGAAGATQAGIAQALHSSRLSAGDQASGWSYLDADLSKRAASDHIVLDVANQAWFESGLPVLAAYLRLLAADFRTGVHEADFEQDPAAAARAINSWVASRTAGHITNLVTPAQLERVVAVLVDAVYMDAPWATPFDASLTAPAPFHLSASTTEQVPTMVTPSLFQAPASSGPGLDAVELAYRGHDLSALVLMPPEGQLSSFEKSLSVARLARIVGGLRLQPVEVNLPKFSLHTALTLNAVLSAMGMEQAFTNSADFSNLSPQPLELSFVVHDAQIEVTEKGTEASAGTAGGAEPTAVERRPPLELFFDHPFLFLVRDDVTGALLFEAQVDNPVG
jgi:serpin B